MFKKEKTVIVNTLIGPKTEIKGDITCEGNLKVDGIIRGNVKIINGSISVGKTGEVYSNIVAKTVNIDGFIEGNIESADVVYINSTGKLNGDIAAKSIIINQGAKFNGKCYMNNHDSEEPRSIISPLFIKE